MDMNCKLMMLYVPTGAPSQIAVFVWTNIQIFYNFLVFESFLCQFFWQMIPECPTCNYAPFWEEFNWKFVNGGLVAIYLTHLFYSS